MPALQLVESDAVLLELMREALERRATDVHFQPEGRSVRVAFRVDGLIQPERLAIETGRYELVVGRLKVLANLNIAERRRPQAGAFVLPVDGHGLEVRTSFLPTIDGESASLRLLTAAHAALPLETLGMTPRTLDRLLALAGGPSGLLLVVGPTGSGKTTTLYALVDEAVGEGRRIITVEDPVERRIPGVTQVEISRAEGFDFAQALSGALRHDPDVISIGEIRDAETARIALSAALSGHLVLASMHADGPHATLERLVHLGVDRSHLAASLVAIVTERLVRTRCTRCDGPRCPRCRGTQFAGRTGLFGLFEPDADLGRRLLAGETSFRGDGEALDDLVSNGLELVRSGATTQAEIDRVLALAARRARASA